MRKRNKININTNSGVVHNGIRCVARSNEEVLEGSLRIAKRNILSTFNVKHRKFSLGLGPIFEHVYTYVQNKTQPNFVGKPNQCAKT